MIYIETGSTDVYYNFGLEYYFAVEKKFPETVFLFWQTTPTLMVGKYQNVLEEINKPFVDAHGIKLVRRMSGGGTIYTDLGGFQFTFIEHDGAEEITFQQYIAPVIDALKEIGVDASFNGRNDLTIDGKKFSGNAQFRLEGSTVHHGSLLFNTNLEQMVEATTVDPYKIISKSIKSVRDRVTNIADHLPGPLDPQEFKKCMVRHIMRGSDKVYVPTEADKARIRQLGQEHFASYDRIFGANPKFNIERIGRFAGGTMRFRIDVRHNIIQSVAITGDFFSTMDSTELNAALVGCRYDRASVLEALKAKGLDNAVYRVTAEEMAAVIAD